MFGGLVADITIKYGSGVQLCDGTNGTPDLRNRFIAGADADSGGVAKTTVTGSAAQSGDGQIPAHSHTLNGDCDLSPNGSGAGELEGTYSNAHVINHAPVTNSVGTGTKNVAVFFALCFITRTADWA